MGTNFFQHFKTSFRSLELFVACDRKDYKKAELLVEKGANVNQVYDDNGLTPLHSATISDSSEIVQLLLRNGARVNGTTKNGDTALHKAAFVGAEKCIEVLLRHGASPVCPNKFNMTPLMVAVWSHATGSNRAYLHANGDALFYRIFRSLLLALPAKQLTNENNLYELAKQYNHSLAVKMIELASNELLNTCDNLKIPKISRAHLKMEPNSFNSDLPTDYRLNCQICMDEERNVCFDCGHGCCVDCSHKLEECHICRKRICFIIPLYI